MEIVEKERNYNYILRAFALYDIVFEIKFAEMFAKLQVRVICDKYTYNKRLMYRNSISLESH